MSHSSNQWCTERLRIEPRLYERKKNPSTHEEALTPTCPQLSFCTSSSCLISQSRSLSFRFYTAFSKTVGIVLSLLQCFSWLCLLTRGAEIRTLHFTWVSISNGSCKPFSSLFSNLTVCILYNIMMCTFVWTVQPSLYFVCLLSEMTLDCSLQSCICVRHLWTPDTLSLFWCSNEITWCLDAFLQMLPC